MRSGLNILPASVEQDPIFFVLFGVEHVIALLAEADPDEPRPSIFSAITGQIHFFFRFWDQIFRTQSWTLFRLFAFSLLSNNFGSREGQLSDDIY